MKANQRILKTAVFLSVLGAWGASSAALALTIVPTSNGESAYSVNGIQTVFYDAAAPLGSFPNSFMNTGFTMAQIGSPSGTNLGDPGRSNILTFQITSGVTAPTGQNLYMIVVVNQDANSPSNGQVDGGMAQINGVNCSAANCSISDATGNFFVVPYTSPSAVGIYPNDICEEFAGNTLGYTDPSCLTSNVGGSWLNIPAAGSVATPLQLNFQVFAATTPPTTTPFTVSALDSAQINLAFQGNPPTISCPTDGTSAWGADITPLDTQLQVNGGVFTATNDTGKAGLSEVFITGASTGNYTYSPNSSFFNYSVNGNTNTNGLSGSVLVTGFTNSDASNTITYDIGAAFQDQSGLVTEGVPGVLGAAGSCTYRNIETSAIRGYLSKNNCFIATAAFRSLDAAPITMLRHFRDTVLLHSLSGRAFVRWYYHWSPPAALWLIDHPIFRFPVLLALVPVELIAFVMLKPLLFGVAFFSGIALLGFALLRTRRRIVGSLFFLLLFSLNVHAAASGPSIEDDLEIPEDQSTHQERLKAREELKLPSRAIGFRFGGSAAYNMSTAESAHPFNQTYGGKYNPDFQFYYEYLFNSYDARNRFKALGWIGMSYYHGHGTRDTSIPMSGGGEYGTLTNLGFRFYTVPAIGELKYELNLNKYFVPYVSAGLGVVGFFELRQDNQDDHHGNSKVLAYSVGATSSLAWISLNHWNLSLEYNSLSSVLSDYSISQSSVFGGVGLEF